MTSGAKRAFITLLVISFAIGGANLLFTARQVNSVRVSSAEAAAASARAAQARATVVQLCESGNQFRAQQVSLWEHLVTVAQPPPHETRGERRRRLATARMFIAYIHKVFAPRNCHAPAHHHPRLAPSPAPVFPHG